MYHILMNTDIKNVQTNLAPFIVNNFYCNYLSGNYMENNLLYVIAMMLKDEIDKLDNINQVDNFLEKTKCGFLLEELRKMPDIQIYFKKVILKTVEKIERTYSFREIKFNTSKILEEVIKLKEEEKIKLFKKYENNILIDNNNINNINNNNNIIINNNINNNIININNEENNQQKMIFIKTYARDITIKEIEKYIEKAKKENKKDLIEYFNKIKNDINSNIIKEIYSNEILMKNIFDRQYSDELFSFYQKEFFEIISFIELLINDLMENLVFLPNSIKYICKIISILLRNKFKDISVREENAFISKFIIEKLLIPIISLPSHNALISEFIISNNTIKTIKIINFIIKKLFSGKLFIKIEEEGEYTPFNWFFIDKIETVFNFFDKAKSVNLPNFIEKYVNNELPKKYIYDYFNENKEQMYANISICFTINNLYYLIKGLNKTEEGFFTGNDNSKKLQKCLERLKTKESINEIKAIDERKMKAHKEGLKNDGKYKDKDKEEIEIENYYLFTEQMIEKKYENLFLIKNKITNFYIDFKKEDENEKIDEKEKNIIKIKNNLYKSLGNFRLLNKSDFNIGTTSSIIKMLNEIKFYMALPSFTLNNNTIPSIWYINSILDYLNKIPEDYKENDYKKLFDELSENLNDSINSLNFEKLIQFRNKLKILNKMNNYYENVKELINNILINENIKNIVGEIFIPIESIFKYDENVKKFDITKSTIKEKLFEEKNPQKDYKNSVDGFTLNFPDITNIQGKNPLFIIKELNINQKINNYFEMIQQNLIKNELIPANQYHSLYKIKIKDYIMDKIYEKIYPHKPDEKDIEIFKKSKSLLWVEPNQIIKKDYYFDSMLPDILNEFKQINKAKTPYKKLNCIKLIIKSIENLIKFNDGEDKEVKDEDIKPILNYIFIKADPFMIFTDIEFIKIFLDNDGKNENNLSIFESIYNLILNYQADNFDLNQEEFEMKCQESLSKEKNNLLMEEYIIN